MKAIRACFLTNALFLIPVSFPATRLTAIILSLSLKNLAFEGESGRKKYMINAQRQVTPPSWKSTLVLRSYWWWGRVTIKKISSHRSGLKVVGRVETPIEMYEPNWDVSAGLWDLAYENMRWVCVNFQGSLTIPPHPREELFKVSIGFHEERYKHVLPNALPKRDFSSRIPKSRH